MKSLSIDIETFSSADLTRSGVYKYSEAPDFEILLFAYSADGGDVHVVDFTAGETLPPEILAALTDPKVIKWAWNAMFERVCLSRWLLGKGEFISPRSWRCSMVWAAALGLPMSLENAGKALKLTKQKLSEGKKLIRKFCTPPRFIPQMSLFDGGEWQTFKEYNRRDVETEMEAKSKFEKWGLSEWEWDLYEIDQTINDRGVQLDMTVVKNATAASERSRAESVRQMHELTELENPNSVVQIKQWLADKGVETESLAKKEVADILEWASAEITEVLLLRQSLAKSSVSKYKAMAKCVCCDNRVRGLFQFYGSRTGRWAGRLVQAQNLPQNHLPDLKQARTLVKSGDFEILELLHDSVPEVLSELIRTAFVPKAGHKLIVADFSAIEARVLAWLAGETWRNEVFATHGKIYEASASQMFNIPLENVDKPLRSKGKVAELALGYGGSVGALKSMGALDMGLTENELPPLVTAWRTANPNIVQFWHSVENAALKAVRQTTAVVVHGLTFSCESGMLFITLPSGRRLAYISPKIGINRFDKRCVTYKGVSNKRWVRTDSYGGKWTENICQAVARDLLAFAMKTLADYDIVMHIHDEIVIETDRSINLETVCEQMSILPPWAAGLILKADGFETTQFYRKD